MAITFTSDAFTLDELAGLQNAASPAPGDADDKDIARTSLPAEFNALLFTAMTLDPAFPDGGRIAQSTSDFVVVSSTSVTGITLAGQFNGGTGTAEPLVAFTGGNFAAGGDTGLTTTAGDDIHLFSDYTGNPAAGASLTGNVVFGVSASGEIVFAIYMKETVVAGEVHLQFSMVTFEAIQHPDGDASHDENLDLGDFLSLTVGEASGFDFSVVPSGKINFLMAPSLDGSGAGLLVTSLTNVSQINTSQASEFGVTIGWGSQGINAGETVVVHFIASGIVNDLAIPNLSAQEAKVATNIEFGSLDVLTQAQFTIAQTVGSQTHALKLAAWNSGTNQGDGDVSGGFHAQLLDDTRVTITEVSFTRGGTTVTRDSDGNFGSTGVHINFVTLAEANASNGTLFEGQVVITGVLVGDVINYVTESGHSRVDITGVNGNFDVGQFVTSQTGSSTIPIGQAFEIEDFGPTIDLAPTAATIAVDELVGTDGSDEDEPSNADPDDETASDAPDGAIGYAVTTVATLFTQTADAGTDGEASKVYALVLSAGATGLIDTATGSDVVLSQALDGSIEGRTDDLDAFLVFTIEVDDETGDVTTTLFRALDHGPDLNDHDSAVSMESGLVQLQVELTDGDTDTASDTIELGSLIEFEDDGPTIDLTPLSPTIAVDELVGTDGSDEDELGNADPDDETAPGAPGNAIGYVVTTADTLFTQTADAGTDGEASKVYSLVLSAGATGLTDTATGSDVVLSQALDGSIEGRTDDLDAFLVFTIEVDDETGDVTTTLFRALDHGPDLNDHDSAVSMESGLVQLQVELTDGDTDTASDTIELGSLIDFEDDGPTIDLTPLSPTIAVDESVGTDGSDEDELGNADPDDETAPGAPGNAIGYAVTTADTLFTETADAGTDGEASKVYSLVLSAGATGLIDTATGSDVVLSQVLDGSIEGRTDDLDAFLVFTIEVDDETGDVTTTLFRALDHGPDLNDHDSAVSMESGLVQLQVELTDGDTDTASDTIELGSLIEFEDDGPAIDLTPLSPTIAVDESVGTDGSDEDEPGNADPDDETAPGGPDGAIGYAVTTADTLFTEIADAGTDGEASKVYSLVLSAGATGLIDIATGSDVVLSQALDGSIEGRTDDLDAFLVFTIEVDDETGDVTTTLFRALDHGPDLNDHDSAVSMESGLVQLQVELTDGDTDTASDTIELGSLIDFEDDGPAVDVVVADVTGDALAALHRNLDETINPDEDESPNGADNYADGEDEDDNGDLDDVIVDGVANEPVWLSAPGGFNDGLGDQAMGRLSTDAGQLSALFADAADFADFGSDGQGDLGGGKNRTDTLSLVLSAAAVQTTVIATAVAGSPIEDFDISERTIWLVQVSDTVIEGRIAGEDGIGGEAGDEYVIFRLTLVDADDPENATIVTEQFAPVQHPDAALFDESIELLMASANESLSVRWTTEAADGDGDTATGSADVVLIDDTNSIVSIDDDGPGTEGVGADIPLWEDGLPDGNLDNDGDPQVTTNATPVDLKLQVIGGSDGVKSFGLSTDVSGLLDLGLTSGGVELAYVVQQVADGDDTLIASANGTPIFTVVVTEDGKATATLLGPLDHSQDLPGQKDGDEIVIDLTDLLEAFEGDNDPVQFLSEALRLVIEDDAPVLTVGDSDTPATYVSGAQGEWSDTPGADGLASLDVTFDSYKIGATGTVKTPAANSFTKTDDFEFEGSITDDFNGDGKNETVPFTLTFNDDGTYDLVVDNPPGQTSTFDTSQGSLAAGGPDAVQTLLFGGGASGNDDIVFFGVVPTAPRSDPEAADVDSLLDLVERGIDDLTEAEIEALFPIPALINSATQMNVSTAGIGVNNNNMDGNSTAGIQATDESFVVNPETVVNTVTVFIDNSVGGYNPAAEQLYYRVYFIDGSVSDQILVTAGMLTSATGGGNKFTIDHDKKEIDAVQLTMGMGKIKIPVISFTTETSFNPQPLVLEFTAEMFDGDDDSDEDGFSVHLDPDVV